MIVIGIDPGTTTVWYAIIEKQWNMKKLLDYWVIQTTPKMDLKDKIIEISHDIELLIEKYSPQRVIWFVFKIFTISNLVSV